MRDYDKRHTVSYTETWYLEKTWREGNGVAAAPSSNLTTLTDAPGFQRLPPEVQAALLQRFGVSVDTEAWQVPEQSALLVNYPNPFTPETWIPYQLFEAADVTLTIYDIHGRDVRTLDLGQMPAGLYQSKSRAAYWDGRNALGELVASGIYFYHFETDDLSALRKMVMSKVWKTCKPHAIYLQAIGLKNCRHSLLC